MGAAMTLARVFTRVLNLSGFLHMKEFLAVKPTSPGFIVSHIKPQNRNDETSTSFVSFADDLDCRQES